MASAGDYADENPIRFSTKYVDAETGLSYFGYRYYAPKLGRWLSRDPIGERGGVNLYGFVENGPTNAVDPLGLEDLTGPDCDAVILALRPCDRMRTARYEASELLGPAVTFASGCQGAVEGASEGAVDSVIGAGEGACEIAFIACDTVMLTADTYAMMWPGLGGGLGYDPLSQYCQALERSGDRCFEVGRSAGVQVLKNGPTGGGWGLCEDLASIDVDDPDAVRRFSRTHGGSGILTLAGAGCAGRGSSGVTIATDSPGLGAPIRCIDPRILDLLKRIRSTDGVLPVCRGELKLTDVADLTAATRALDGCANEFAIFRIRDSRQLCVAELGPNGGGIPRGSRLIVHSQPGCGLRALVASLDDRRALGGCGQRSSVILDESGCYMRRFRACPENDLDPIPLRPLQPGGQ